VARRIGFWGRFAAVVVKPVLLLWTQRTWRGMEHVPRSGPVIIVANHISHADPLVCAHFVYEAGRWPQFLAKASLFRVPVLGWLLHKVKQIPVERGSVDAARSLEVMSAALRDNGTIIIYPEGTITREPNLWPMRGKTGAARLALATGAPIIPVVMWGPQNMFDARRAKLRLRPRIPVTVVAGPPIDMSRWSGVTLTKAVLGEVTDEIMLRLRDMLAEIRGETPPPLWNRPTQQPVAESGAGA